MFSEAMCTREELEPTEFYNDWVRPQEDIVAGGGALLCSRAVTDARWRPTSPEWR